MKLVMISSAASMALAGCASMPSIAPPIGPCVVDDGLRMHLIGSDFKMAQRNDIQRRANAPVARILRPGDARTMDMRADRLNIMLSEDGKVNDLGCG